MVPHKLLLAFALFVLQVSLAQAGCTIGALPFILQNNTNADATQVDANFNQITSGINSNCAGAGANNDITSLGALTTPLNPAQGGTAVFVASGDVGSANARAVTTTSNFSLVGGWHISTISNFSNSGPTTMQVNGGAAVPIFRKTQFAISPLNGGELIGGYPYELIYNGSANIWLLLGETFMIGEMRMYMQSGVTAPLGWLIADGSSFVCSSFQDLCNIIGTQYGGTSSNPNLPDTRGRVMAGLDNYSTSTGAAGRLNNISTGCGTAFNFLGATCANGSERHFQQGNELATHTHGLNDPGHIHGVTDPGHSHAPPSSATFTTNNNGNQASGASRAGDVTGANTASATTGITINSNGTGITIDNSGLGTPMPIVNPNFGVVMIIRY